MNGMFSGAEQFNQDISGWKTNNVTDMKSMFNYALSFEGDISKWNTTNVTNMGGMFLGASKFNSNIIGWDVSNVKQMEYMFAYAETFNRNIKSWNVKSVTKFDKMFLGARLMKENFNAPDTPSSAWFSGLDTGNSCNDNLNRFLNGTGSEVSGIHLSGNWLSAFTPKSGLSSLLYKPEAKLFKLKDDLVVFVAKHRRKFKMVGYNFCNSMNGKEAFIENRLLDFSKAPFNDINRVEAARWAWNNATMKSNNYDKLWAYQESIPGYTPQGNYYAVSFGNTYGYRSKTQCRKNFNMFKKPILLGSEVEQQRKLESATFNFFYRPYTLSNATSVIIYCFFDNSKNRKVKTYESDWTRDRKWYMAAYDFCEMPPKLLEIRTRDMSYATYSTLDTPKSSKYWTGFARLRALWNESYALSPDSNKVKIELQRR
jgi:surface protein